MKVTLRYQRFEEGAGVPITFDIPRLGPQDGFDDREVMAIAEDVFAVTNLQEGPIWDAIVASGELERTREDRQHTSMCSQDSVMLEAVGEDGEDVIATCLSQGWAITRVYGRQWDSEPMSLAW